MKILLDPIFKSKDRVYHYKYGWGTIMDIHNGINERILIEFDEVKNLIREMKSEGNLLSFTEYTLEGFSQERPEPLPNRGDIVWVRDFEDEEWGIKHFSHKEINGGYRASTYFNAKEPTIWRYMTTKNPYENESTTQIQN